MGLATRRLIISAVKIPNAIPITPTKTASHAAFVAGERGAKTSNKSEAIGQIDADTAHTIPRPRSDNVKMFGVRSARSSRKKTGNNPQMPEQARIQWILHLKQRADKNRYAQKPGAAANRGGKPGQVNQPATRLREFLQRRALIVGFPLKAMKQIPKRKDAFQPQIDPDGINNGVVNHYRSEETLS